jgi:uncharacterized protein (DUF58 family)
VSVWRRIRSALDTGMRQQITRSGLLFTASIVVIAIAAFASANNLLFLILAAMLATLLVSGFISRLSLAGLELEFLHPEHISARRKVSGRVVIYNDKLWIPSFSIQLSGAQDSGFESSLYFPSIPARARLEETVELYFARRGRYRENTFSVSTRFPFGFSERRIVIALRRDILVYPSVEPQVGFEQLLLTLTGEIETHLQGRGGDFYRIRPYEAFESSRHVDWKATAHTGTLQVREYAREQDHTIALLLDLEQDGEIFERAVDCSAYLAWNLAQRNVRLSFTTQEYTARLPEDGDIYTILKYLALVSPVRGKTAPPPDDQRSYQVIISSDPGRLSEAGWATNGESNGFVVRPDRLVAGPASANDAAAAGVRSGRA